MTEIQNKKEILIKTITPLQVIFWGAIFSIFDIKIQLFSISFDILNDTFGLILITIGVIQLSLLYSSKRYDLGMTFVALVAITSIGYQFLFYISPDWYMRVITYSVYLSSLQFTAIIIFCISMHWMSLDLNLSEISKDWQNTSILFVIFFIVPNSIFQQLFSSGKINGIPDKLFYVLVIFLLILESIPVAHILIVSRRMQKKAEKMISDPIPFKGAL